MGKVIFNRQEILRNVVSSGALDNLVVKLADDKLKLNTDLLLTEFKDDDISQEIAQGIDAKDSKFLSGAPGTLFSFIGFLASSSPILDVLEYLKNKIKITKNINYRITGKDKLNVSVRALIPNKEELSEISKTEWDGPWLFKISTGISGLGYYISKMLQGRSLGGVQSRKKIRDTTFKKQSYFSKMYKDFVKRLSNTNNFK